MPTPRQPAHSAAAVLDVGSPSARALRHLPSTWPSQWPPKSFSDLVQTVVTGAPAMTYYFSSGFQAGGASGDALLDARCCTEPSGCHQNHRTTFPLGAPSAWADALQGFSGSAGASSATVRSTEVRQAALARLPHLASSSSIIWTLCGVGPGGDPKDP